MEAVEHGGGHDAQVAGDLARVRGQALGAEHGDARKGHGARQSRLPRDGAPRRRGLEHGHEHRRELDEEGRGVGGDGLQADDLEEVPRVEVGAELEPRASRALVRRRRARRRGGAAEGAEAAEGDDVVEEREHGAGRRRGQRVDGLDGRRVGAPDHGHAAEHGDARGVGGARIVVPRDEGARAWRAEPAGGRSEGRGRADDEARSQPHQCHHRHALWQRRGGISLSRDGPSPQWRRTLQEKVQGQNLKRVAAKVATDRGRTGDGH